jgi:serine/threonine protein kinase/tetratricopeptide (TPR) repeat protein
MLRDGFDEDPEQSIADPATQDSDGPRLIDKYQLLEELGRGGMGVVYLAEQKAPVRRRVALKIIKLGMDTRQVIARFEAERQALALMDHPNIAKVLDAGATDAGRPFFVMEWVNGIKITQFCDRNHLSTPERLSLFVQVCRAIQHAHQKGLIHRDIKPSNILVTIQDGAPVPKVIDFGVAKATGSSLTDKTLFTAFEQLLGTPAYMSPEQADMGGVDIDTRSDIYSLGVLLYELLTGRTPFDADELLSAGLDAMRRRIREVDPPRPSTRLTSLTNEEVANVAKDRRSEPPSLINLVRGDLDWIVMKALEKQRDHRYETANGLAMDIQRHLNHEPVLARPAGSSYRFRKWVRRNKATFAATLGIAAALTFGMVVSTWQAVRAVQAKNQASKSERKAQLISQFLTGMFNSIDPAVAKLRDITVREILDEAGRTVGTSFSNEPLSELAMRKTLIDIYGKLGRDDQGLPHAQAALRLAQAAHGNKEHADVAEGFNGVGLSLEALGRPAEALSQHEAALVMYQRLHEGDHPDVATTLGYLGLCLESLGRSAEALPRFQSALAMFQRIFPGDHAEVAECRNNLASCRVSLGQAAQALPDYLAALTMRQRIYKGDHPDVVTSLNNVATCLDSLGRGPEALTNYDAALVMSRRIYKGDHLYVAISLNNVAACLQGLGRNSEALAKYEESLAMRQRIYNSDHPYIANCLNNVGSCLRDMDRWADSLPKFQDALAMYQRIYKQDHPAVAACLANVAFCLDTLGCSSEAMAKYEDALAMQQRLHSEASPAVITGLNNLGLCLEHLGRPAEALSRFEQALTMSQRLSQGDYPYTAGCLQNLAFGLSALGRKTDAMAKYQEAAAMFDRLASSQPANDFLKIGLAKAQERMGDLLLEMSRTEDAREMFQHGLEQTQSVLATDHESTLASQASLRLRVKLGLESAEVVIRGVVAGRRGYQLGLQQGDVICRYAGEPIVNVDKWKWVNGRTNSTPVALEVRRNGTLLRLTTEAGALGLQCEDLSTGPVKANSN